MPDGTNVFPVLDNTSDVVYWPILQQAQLSNVRTDSVFVNDTWRLNNNLSFNVGLRFDKNKASRQPRLRRLGRLRLQPAPRRDLGRQG